MRPYETKSLNQASLTSKILRGYFDWGGYFEFSAEGGNTPLKNQEVRFLAYLSLNLTELRLLKLIKLNLG